MRRGIGSRRGESGWSAAGTIVERHLSRKPALSIEKPIQVNGRPRVLSGMRPTGKLHLGNYMGALANWVKLQDDYECYFFMADWHALTTDYADTSRWPATSRRWRWTVWRPGSIRRSACCFCKARCSRHAELYPLFSMIMPVSWLERVPTYKEQQENIVGKDLSTYGFLGYPLLQAADILLYQPQFVPVGQDQVVHVELTREIARRFNHFYKLDGPTDPSKCCRSRRCC